MYSLFHPRLDKQIMVLRLLTDEEYTWFSGLLGNAYNPSLKSTFLDCKRGFVHCFTSSAKCDKACDLFRSSQKPVIPRTHLISPVSSGLGCSVREPRLGTGVGQSLPVVKGRGRIQE